MKNFPSITTGTMVNKTPKIYYSREDRVMSALNWLKTIDLDRMSDYDTFKRMEAETYDQYDRMLKALDVFKADMDTVFDNIYELTAIDEDSNVDEIQAGIAEAADDMTNSWAEVQVGLSVLAVRMGINGNQAFEGKF